MTFTEWIKNELGRTWVQLEKETTAEQRALLFEDYLNYCRDHNLKTIFNFR